jgi:hypothetical protein
MNLIDNFLLDEVSHQAQSNPRLRMIVIYRKAFIPEVTPEVERLIKVLNGEMGRSEIQELLSLSDEKHFRENYQQKAIGYGLIEMTIPDKPRSSHQKYRLTVLGKQLKEKLDS